MLIATKNAKNKRANKNITFEACSMVPTFDVVSNNSISLINQSTTNKTLGIQSTIIPKPKTGISSPRPPSIVAKPGERKAKSLK